MKPMSLIATASAMPENIVGNDYFDVPTTTGPMFRGTAQRHHMSDHEQASDMIMRATDKLCDRINIQGDQDIDIILTNVSLPDLPFTGCGAEIAHRLGANPRWVLDVHNTGCVSFVFMMELGRSLMASSDAKSALICNVQSAAGRVFGQEENRKEAQSAVPGDGCGVGYLVANDESPVQSIITKSYGAYACDMQITARDDRKWWQPGDSSFRIDFSRRKVGSIVQRANVLVPGIIEQACEQASITKKDIDLLVTNQPNPVFLRNWREALEVPAEKHVDTFEDHGNLFGAAMPIAFERAVMEKKAKPGSKVVFGGFSHAGDYAAAAVVDWQSRNASS